jgi:serine/threonine protein phosphatase PrpC
MMRLAVAGLQACGSRAGSTLVEFDVPPVPKSPSPRARHVRAVKPCRLCRRGQANATCLVLTIERDGGVKLVNAGHIAPYLNGEQLAMEGALPLGIMEGAEFSVMHFHLKDDDKLMLMSDGIAEATDADGHLFGFERVHELPRAATTAAELASAAQRFGQEDDISVISVTRTPVIEPGSV